MEKKTFAEAIKGTTGAETVLRVLNEGGSISVTRTPAEADTWQFYVTNDESGWLQGLTDEFPPGEGYGINESEPVATFDEALRLLDGRPSHEMRPDVVHPDFRALVWAAVLERRMAPKRERMRWQSRLSDDWLRLARRGSPRRSHPGERPDLEGATAARALFAGSRPATVMPRTSGGSLSAGAPIGRCSSTLGSSKTLTSPNPDAGAGPADTRECSTCT